MNDIKIVPNNFGEKKPAGSGMNISLESVSKLGERLTSKGDLWFGLSIIFLIVTILLSFGLWGYKMSLTGQENDTSEKIAGMEGQRDKEFEVRLTSLKKKIENMKNVLDNRAHSSVVFALIEELVVPGVRFADFSADINKGEIVLEAEADTFNALNKQIVVFEQDERIEKMSLSSANLDEGGKVTSKIDIKIRTSILYE